MNDLKIVELERLILHEAHDDDRLALLRNRVREEGLQNHPVIVSRREESYLVLDGAHRVQALKDLGCKFILVQSIEPPEKSESWGHLLKTPERPEFREIAGAKLSEKSSGFWVAEIELGSGDRTFVEPVEPGLAGDIVCLWGLQKFYPEGGVVRRVEPEADVELAEGEMIFRYRPFTPEELISVVCSGTVLPAGITRFRVQERILCVRFPLSKLKDGELEERDAELRSLVEERLRENRVRYYGEPVVLFE